MTVKGGIRKMKSKKIRSYCDRLIFLLGIASAVILLKFSNAPNYFNISILNKPHGDWNIFISILTSYIVTAGFYFIMNFIPDKIKEQEELEASLPHRCCMHRDIQLFIADTLEMWGNVIKYAGERMNESDLPRIESILDMFDKDVIKNSAEYVKLFAEANSVSMSGKRLLWKDSISYDLSEICEKGEKILDKYQKDIPLEVYFPLKRLLDSSPLIGILDKLYHMILKVANENYTLLDCIAKNVDEKIFGETSEDIASIYNWVNEEYDELVKQFDEKHKADIYKIDLKNYLVNTVAINLNDYSKNVRFIAENTDVWTDGTQYDNTTSMLIPIKNIYDSVNISTQKDTKYAFLIDDSVKLGEKANYAKDTTKVKISTNVENIKIPGNSTFLYIVVRTREGNTGVNVSFNISNVAKNK